MSTGDSSGIVGRGKGIGRSMSAGVVSAGAAAELSSFDGDGEGSGAPAMTLVSRGEMIGMEGNGTGRLINAGDASFDDDEAGASPVGEALDAPSLDFGEGAGGGVGLGDGEGSGFPATISVITGERPGTDGNGTDKSNSAGSRASRFRECLASS